MTKKFQFHLIIFKDILPTAHQLTQNYVFAAFLWEKRLMNSMSAIYGKGVALKSAKQAQIPGTWGARPLSSWAARLFPQPPLIPPERGFCCSVVPLKTDLRSSPNMVSRRDLLRIPIWPVGCWFMYSIADHERKIFFVEMLAEGVGEAEIINVNAKLSREVAFA